MKKQIKRRCLIACLFIFLLVAIGGGLKLSPLAALIAAATGTPLIVTVARWCSEDMNRRATDTDRSGELEHNLAESQWREATLRSHLRALFALHHHYLDHESDFEVCAMPGCRTCRRLLHGDDPAMAVQNQSAGKVA
jgi:hypothetical protein